MLLAGLPSNCVGPNSKFQSFSTTPQYICLQRNCLHIKTPPIGCTNFHPLGDGKSLLCFYQIIVIKYKPIFGNERKLYVSYVIWVWIVVFVKRANACVWKYLTAYNFRLYYTQFIQNDLDDNREVVGTLKVPWYIVHIFNPWFKFVYFVVKRHYRKDLIMTTNALGPLLLTWFNFNPGMDK